MWSARVEWLQRQRPMWREHDAKLASAWRRDETADVEIGEMGSEVDDVIVLPDRDDTDDRPASG